MLRRRPVWRIASRAVIAPLTGGGLTQVSGSFDSIYGEVSSAWKREGNRVTLTAGIPVNTDGIIRLEPGATQPQGDAPFASAITAVTTVLSLLAVPLWCALLL